MKNKVSTKDLFLLGILFALLVYYFAAKGPFVKKIEELKVQRDNLGYQISALSPKYNQMLAWEKELERLLEKNGGELKSIPDYNNINNVITEMSMIFDGDSTYSINFSDPVLNDHIVTRDIKITFSVYSYAEVIDKLIRINDSENKYQITTMSISLGSNDYYAITMNLIAFEYSETNSL